MCLMTFRFPLLITSLVFNHRVLDNNGKWKILNASGGEGIIYYIMYTLHPYFIPSHKLCLMTFHFLRNGHFTCITYSVVHIL